MLVPAIDLPVPQLGSVVFFPSIGLFVLLALVLLVAVGGRALRTVWDRGSTGLRAGVTYLLVAVVVIAGLLFLNAFQGWGHQKDPSIAAASNLKQIGLGILMYAQDNGDCLPPTLGSVYPYVGEGRVFVVEGSRTRAPKSGADADAGQCDFVYSGSGMQSLAENASVTVIAQTKPGLPYTCLLYLDGHVECHSGTPRVGATGGKSGAPSPANRAQASEMTAE